MSEPVLGWKVTAGLEPQYWLSASARPGLQANTDLIIVKAEAMGTHTIVVGQSGSGKSFFLGRLIEELALQSKANFLILDPNADFSSVHQVQEETLWTNAAYDPRNRSGKLPHETSRSVFSKRWKRIRIQILTANENRLFSPDDQDTYPYKALRLWWPSLSSDVIAEEEPRLQSQLYHCHAFVQAVGHLLLLKSAPRRLKQVRKSEGPIDAAERLYNIWRADIPTQLSPSIPENAKLLLALNEEFHSQRLLDAVPFLREQTAKQLGLRWYSRSRKTGRLLRAVSKLENAIVIGRWLKRVKTALLYVDEDAARFYFGKAREYETSGILAQEPQTYTFDKARIVVADLPSLDEHNARLLAVNAMLRNEWERAKAAWNEALRKDPHEDNRVPTFIVLDEAHHFIPADPRGKAEFALREQFRTIAAEGRKYGLFLILASQRPDKLDSLVLSECENKALMKLDSDSVLRLTQRNLGLESIPQRMLEKCLEFANSRALITGKWTTDQPQLLYCAARRTVEGGRNLQPDFWANPY